MAQDRTKRPPRETKTAPRPKQDARQPPWRCSGSGHGARQPPWRCSGSGHGARQPPWQGRGCPADRSKMPPRWPKSHPRRPKTANIGSKSGPKGPNITPRGPQDAPKRHQFKILCPSYAGPSQKIWSKTLPKIWSKIWPPQIKNTSGRSISKISFNLLQPAYS